MKKLLTIALLSLLIFSCKKDETKPETINNVPASHTIRVVVNSNFQYPTIMIERDTSTIKRFNENAYKFNKPVLVDTAFTTSTSGKYRFYTYCSKSTQDSTKWMLDNKKLWNGLKVYVDGQIQYDKIDSVGYYGGGTNKIVSNVFYINL